MKALFIGAAAALFFAAPASADRNVLTLDQAIKRAVETNPRVGEAAANRRAVDQEVRQAQGALLPQVRLRAEYGSERNRRFDTLVAPGANNWFPGGGEAGVVVRQLLFDGGATLNQIYRQMARSDAAAWRTLERSELVALDVVEAYLDILRFTESLAAARRNIAAHQRFLNNIESRVSGGRAGIGDSQQVRERVRGAQAVEAELRIRLEDARAAFRRSVGTEPNALRMPVRLAGLPSSRAAALDAALAGNPTLQAARSDVTAAQLQSQAALGAYGPQVALELRSNHGRDSSNIRGAFDDASARVVVTWDIFDGGTNVARRGELAERVGEQQMRLSVLQRSAFESIDRAWGARENSGARVTSLASQVNAAQSVVATYGREFELGQRTILDLLNAQNSLFNAQISLAGARTVAVFSDYQLLAATGQLLRRINAQAPVEARAPSTRPEARNPLPMPLNLIDPALARR